MSDPSGALPPDYPNPYRDPLPPTSGTSSSGAHAVRPADTGATGGTSTKDAAKEQAARVGDEAKQSGAHVAGVAKEQAAGVAGEAGRQAKDLLHQGRGELASQASSQQQRAATGLTSVGDQLRSLVDGSPQQGIATDLARQAADQVAGAARWLESREPADLLTEVQQFARRRPGTFLAIAAGVGLLAGRLTRGAVDDARDTADTAGSGAAVSGYGTGSQGFGTGSQGFGTDPYAGTSSDVLDPSQGVSSGTLYGDSPVRPVAR